MPAVNFYRLSLESAIESINEKILGADVPPKTTKDLFHLVFNHLSQLDLRNTEETYHHVLISGYLLSGCNRDINGRRSRCMLPTSSPRSIQVL